MKYIGIDLHSNCFTVFTICDNGRKSKASYKLDGDSIRTFKKKLNRNCYAMLEASANSFRFAELMRPLVKQLLIANPCKLKLINPVYVPERSIQELRSLCCTYKLLKKQIGATKNRIHSILRQNLHPCTKQYIFGKKVERRYFLSNSKKEKDFRWHFFLKNLNIWKIQSAK